jgi:hypothetical protein
MIPLLSCTRSPHFIPCLRILAALVLTNPVSAALFRTNLDQAGPPPNCFESPRIRLTITNPAGSGQIWDVTIMENRFIPVGWMSTGGYYTGPQATGEVVRLQPGDGLHLWQARGNQVVNGTPIVGFNWVENHTIAVSMIGPTRYDVSTTVSPAGAGAVSGGGSFDAGSSTTLRASPNAGYFFENWSGDLSGTSNPQNLRVDGNKTVNARFVANSPPSVSLTAPGSQSITVGTTLRLTTRATDPNGNITQHNLDIRRPAGDWNFQGGFATSEPFQGGPRGSGGNSNRSANFSFDEVGTYIIRSAANDGSGWVHSNSATITVAPAVIPNRDPTIAWTAQPSSADHLQSYTVAARAQDADGNLSRVRIWKNGALFANSTTGNGSTREVSNTSTDNGATTIRFTAQAEDEDGVVSPVISHTVTIASPPNVAPSVTLVSPSAQTIEVGSALVIRSRATDANGNLTRHHLDIQRPAGDWNFEGGFATGEPFQGGPVNNAANSIRTASFRFDDIGTYRVRAAANDGSGWVHTSTVTITVNPAIIPNRDPTIAWTAQPSSADHSQSYTVAASAQDADGNLAEVQIWKNGTLVDSVGGGTGSLASINYASSDTGPTTVTYTAQARDSEGATSPMISHSLSISPPVPIYFSLTTQSESGGSVSPGGSYLSGSAVAVTALADSSHEFIGWAGEASGTSNPLSLVMDRDKTVTARFGLRTYTLSTHATVGGNVTPGGTYPHGSIVTVSASSEPGFRFVDWVGDIASAVSTIAITMHGPRFVEAQFVSKSNQSIIFAALSDVNPGVGTISLSASASSGLPVSFIVLSGPALLTGSDLQILGPGPVLVQADQPGDDFYRPAPSVTRSFSVVTPARVKYRADNRTLLSGEEDQTSVPFIIEQP